MSDSIDTGKRRFLTAAASVVGGAGVAAVAIPFVASMSPSAMAKAAGAPIEVPIDKIESGQQLIVEWRKQPVWILRRTPEVVANLTSLDAKLVDPNSDNPDQQPEYCKNGSRAIRDEILVLVGVCTHLGCSPTYIPEVEAESKNMDSDWKGGFYCPCHGSKFDLAGRVYKGMPAPTNLVVPPHHFAGDNLLVIGETATGAA